jgi:Transposase
MTRHSSAPDGTAQELAPRQTVVLMHLLTGVGVEQAAKLAGVGERTVWTWLRDHPLFARELRARQRQAMEDATSKLQAGAGEAVDALKRVMNDPKAPHSAVVSAAKTVLEAGYRGVELGELLERLDLLEARTPMDGE